MNDAKQKLTEARNLAASAEEANLPRTLIAAVMADIQRQVASRALTPGSRLPSIRALAGRHGISKSTVVEAYERLRAEGVIQSRPGSGYYVSAPLAPLSLAKTEPRLDRAIDPLWISRQSLDDACDVLKPGCGWLPADWLPAAALRRALRKVTRSEDNVLCEYSTSRGHPALRQLLSRRLATNGITISAEHILLADSGTQAIDLLCRCLLQRGDIVLVDDPCYFNFHALLKAHGVQIVSVPYTVNGPDTSQMQKSFASYQVRLYITNSGIHNPTGASLSADTAHRVLSLAEQYDVTIIEDDIFADFEHQPAVRLAALDGQSRVCHIGSFSKTLSAALRCGFIAAPKNLIEELLDLKIATSFGNANLAAELTFLMLTDSGYRKHLHELRHRLDRLRASVSRRLLAMGVQPWLDPDAGMYLWCRLPAGMDAALVARAALSQQVVLAPGNAFSLSQDFSSFMRFNVSQSQDERVFKALETGMRAAL